MRIVQGIHKPQQSARGQELLWLLKRHATHKVKDKDISNRQIYTYKKRLDLKSTETNTKEKTVSKQKI